MIDLYTGAIGAFREETRGIRMVSVCHVNCYFVLARSMQEARGKLMDIADKNYPKTDRWNHVFASGSMSVMRDELLSGSELSAEDLGDIVGGDCYE